MADPEIQGILKSPEIQTVLNDLQNDPKAASKAFQNPDIAAKLNKLIASGILRMGWCIVVLKFIMQWEVKVLSFHTANKSKILKRSTRPTMATSG